MAEGARALRAELEALQGRAKQARAELELAHTQGFGDELRLLTRAAADAEAEAAAIEREARDAGLRLAAVRHAVAQAERRLRTATVALATPAVVALTLLFVVFAGWAVGVGLQLPHPQGFWGRATVIGLSMVPPALLGWLWRRRLRRPRRSRSPS